MGNTTKQTTLKAFIAEHKISAEVQTASSNPLMEDGGRDMDHYAVTLKHGRKRMSVTFSMGRGLRREPNADDVLDCLASDAATSTQSFEYWCGDLGYDVDSRKAERTFKAVRKQSERLCALLGDVAFYALLYHTERL